MKTIARIGGGSSQHYDPSLKSKWQHMVSAVLFYLPDRQTDRQPVTQTDRKTKQLTNKTIYGKQASKYKLL